MQKRQQLIINSSLLSSGQRRLAFGHFLIILLLALFALSEPGTAGERRRTRRANNYPGAGAQVEARPSQAANLYADTGKNFNENGTNAYSGYTNAPMQNFATINGTTHTRAYPPPRLPDLDLEVPIIDYSREPRPQEAAEQPEGDLDELFAEASPIPGEASGDTSAAGESPMPGESEGGRKEKTVNPDPNSESALATNADRDVVADRGRKALGYLDGELIEDIQVPVPAEKAPSPVTGAEIADGELSYGDWKDYQPRVYIEATNTQDSYQVIKAPKNTNRGIMPRTRYIKPVPTADNNNCNDAVTTSNIRRKDGRYTRRQQRIPQSNNSCQENIPNYSSTGPTPYAAYVTAENNVGYTIPDPIPTYYPAPEVRVTEVPKSPVPTDSVKAGSCAIPAKPEAQVRKDSPAGEPPVPVPATRNNGIVKRTTTPVFPRSDPKPEPEAETQLEPPESAKGSPTIKPEVKPDSRPGSGSNDKPKAIPEPQSEAKPGIAASPESGDKPNAKPEINSQSSQLPLVASSPLPSTAATDAPTDSVSDEVNSDSFHDKYYATNDDNSIDNSYIMEPLNYPTNNYKEHPERSSGPPTPPIALPKLSFQTPQLGTGGNIPPPQTTTRRSIQEAHKSPSSVNNEASTMLSAGNKQPNDQKTDNHSAGVNPQTADKTPASEPTTAVSSAPGASEVAKTQENSRVDKTDASSEKGTMPPPSPPMRPETLANQEPWRQQTPAPPPTRAEIEAYRAKLEQRLLERYNNLPDHAGQVAKVTVVLSKPVDISLDGTLMRAEFDQLVYDPWGKRIPELEQEYFAVTFGAGGPRQVRSEPSIRIGLDKEAVYSEHAPLPADPFKAIPADAAFQSNPKVKMPNWWRPEFRD